ncbi:hypothetical protein MIAR_06490 [Microbacterium arabinogalactanolyticum]|uniref:Uncharacterized protein n=1 Tax=Microbacterium arabinogalactanolyticum TaxID=69365 RepID=A0ABQ5NF40_9MICO|nr:hypothetical protein MIAR_06490 [Microbacterium arabinogalactanolyticum]
MLSTRPYAMFDAISAGSPSVDASYGACGIVATAGSGFTSPTGAEGSGTEAIVSVAVMMMLTLANARAGAQHPVQAALSRRPAPA